MIISFLKEDGHGLGSIPVRIFQQDPESEGSGTHNLCLNGKNLLLVMKY